MPKHAIPVPASITELQAQFEQFRSTHSPRTKLPESLWQSAVELARRRGVYAVARPLRLDYTKLKKHASGSFVSSAPRRKRTQPRFVELLGAPARASMNT